MNFKKHIFTALITASLMMSSCADGLEKPYINEAPFRAAASKALSLSTSSGDCHDCTVTSSSGIYTITTTGTDPYLRSTRTMTAYDAALTVLSFEYQAEKDISSFKLYFCPPEAESTASQSWTLSSTSQWKQVDIDISSYRTDYSWALKTSSFLSRWYLRFNVTSAVGNVIKIRNLTLRELTDEEKSAQAEAEAFAADKQAFADRVTNYLDASFTSQVTQVEVTSTEVIVRGITSGSERFAVAEITPYENITEMETFPHLTAVRSSDFAIRLPRYVDRDGYNYDRLLSKWAIVSLDDSKQTLASHARYADKVTAKRSPAEFKPTGKKGLLGTPTHTTSDGVRDLTALNLNIACNGFHLQEWLMLHPYTNNGVAPVKYEYGGKTYYINGAKINEFDNLIKNYCAQNMQVVMYVQIWTNIITDDEMFQILVHPERNGGIQLFPNVTTPDAINAYAAIITFLADRYSQSSAMRVHHWIAHNEVNAQEVWANMGNNQPEMYFTDTYLKSMRLIYNITRQYDQNAATLACFEHNWSVAGSNDAKYPAKSVLNNINKYCLAEGDFWWGLGHHPYPYNLSVGRYWDSSVAYADPLYVNFTQSTPCVTFYNLEVLQDWAYLSENLYQGTKKRLIYLCEQGVNSPDYSDTSLNNQAAGVAYAWKKVENLDAIDGFLYYAWTDNTGDGSLRLGLRKFNDTTYKQERKPSWYVWQAAGTSNEESVFAPYLSVCGLTDWNQVMH